MHFLEYTKDPFDSQNLSREEGRIRYMALLAGTREWCILLPSPFVVRSDPDKIWDCTRGTVYDVWNIQDIDGSPGVFLVYVLPIYFGLVNMDTEDQGKLWTSVARGIRSGDCQYRTDSITTLEAHQGPVGGWTKSMRRAFWKPFEQTVPTLDDMAGYHLQYPSRRFLNNLGSRFQTVHYVWAPPWPTLPVDMRHSLAAETMVAIPSRGRPGLAVDMAVCILKHGFQPTIFLELDEYDRYLASATQSQEPTQGIRFNVYDGTRNIGEKRRHILYAARSDPAIRYVFQIDDSVRIETIRRYWPRGPNDQSQDHLALTIGDILTGAQTFFAADDSVAVVGLSRDQNSRYLTTARTSNVSYGSPYKLIVMDLRAVASSFWYTDIPFGEDMLFYHDLRSHGMKTVRLNGAGFGEIGGSIRKQTGVSLTMIHQAIPHKALMARIWPFVSETSELENGVRKLTLRMRCGKGVPGKSNLAGVKAMSKYNDRYLQLYDQWKHENPRHSCTAYSLGVACTRDTTRTSGCLTAYRETLAYVYTAPGAPVNWGDERKSMLVSIGSGGALSIVYPDIEATESCTDNSLIVRQQFRHSQGCDNNQRVTHWLGCNDPDEFNCYDLATVIGADPNPIPNPIPIPIPIPNPIPIPDPIPDPIPVPIPVPGPVHIRKNNHMSSPRARADPECIVEICKNPRLPRKRGCECHEADRVRIQNRIYYVKDPEELTWLHWQKTIFKETGTLTPNLRVTWKLERANWRIE